jgi:hypothetical protein
MRARVLVVGAAGAALAAWQGSGWVRAVALVGLAGVGVLLVVGARLRVAVGGLLAAVGAVLAVAGVAAAFADRVPKQIAVVAGGVALAVAGWWTVRHGREWSSLGAKYERPSSDTPRDMWEAMDRGDDPTRS